MLHCREKESTSYDTSRNEKRKEKRSKLLWQSAGGPHRSPVHLCVDSVSIRPVASSPVKFQYIYKYIVHIHRACFALPPLGIPNIFFVTLNERCDIPGITYHFRITFGFSFVFLFLFFWSCLCCCRVLVPGTLAFRLLDPWNLRLFLFFGPPLSHSP